MINESVPVRLPGGALAPVLLPAYAVGYAIVQLPDDVVRVDIAMKLPAETFMGAFNRAKREYPDRTWIRTSASRNGGGTMGHTDPYTNYTILREQDGTVRIKTPKGDPIQDAYRSLSDRPATMGAGMRQLVSLLERMDVDPPAAVGRK